MGTYGWWGRPPETPTLTEAEQAVRDEQLGREAAHDDEHRHDADAVSETEHVRPPWSESGEHPDHPEVPGQPSPAG